MKASDLKNHNAPSTSHQSSRNLPSQLLYQPPAKRWANKPLKSSSPKSQTVKSEGHSENSSSKMTECKREPLCESENAKEQEVLAYSRISSYSPSSQEDLGGACYTRLKPTRDQCLSERKRGLGRGNLLKLQLLYEQRFAKADKIDDEGDAAHVPSLANPGPYLSADLNHNNNNINNNNHNYLSKPFLKIPSLDCPSLKFHNAETPEQNDFKPFMYENGVSYRPPKCQENILSPPIGVPDKVQHVAEEDVCRMRGVQVKNVTKSFGSGDWESRVEAGSNLSLLSHQKSLRDRNDYSSLIDQSSNLTISNSDSKDTSKIFYSSNQSEDEESADVFDSQASSLTDETYLTVSSHLSDVEENTGGITRSIDDCDQESVSSKSNSTAESLFEDSSADVICPSAKTSFNDSRGDEKTEILESPLSFQEKARDEVMSTVDSGDRISHHLNHQSGDDQLSWSTTRIKNPISKNECSARQPNLKFSLKSDKHQKSDLSRNGSTKYSSLFLPNSGQKSFVPVCPSTVNYQSPTSFSPQPLTASSVTCENSSSQYRASLPPTFSVLQSCNKEKISNQLVRGVSCKRVTRIQRCSWPRTMSGDSFNDAPWSRFKEISFTNQDRWKQSALQYKETFGSVESSQDWKEKYKKRCSEAGHKFLDTHCHIDLMLKNFKRIYATFQEYREAHADSFPKEFGGCVTIFCDPKTFNPQGSLFRSLVNEHNVWIAVGCHPKNAKSFDKRALQHLNECIHMPQVVAVGEMGLDYSGRFHLEADIQKEVFKTQIKLALDVSKPIVIHCRDAEDDGFSILKAECPLNWPIHLHCYTLDFEHAKRWLDTFPNLYIGLTPKVTYGNAFNVHDTASKIPLTRLVLESDAPHFVPSMVPYKQLKSSHPGLVFTVAEKVANLQNRDVKEVLKACWDNSHRLYRINSDT